MSDLITKTNKQPTFSIITAWLNELDHDSFKEFINTKEIRMVFDRDQSDYHSRYSYVLDHEILTMIIMNFKP